MSSEFAPGGSRPRVTQKQIREMQENYKKASELARDTSSEEAEEKAILDELFDEKFDEVFSQRQKVGLYIGRFQPLHLGHENILQQMMEENDLVLVGIGTGGDPRENPFSFEIVSSFFQNYLSDTFQVFEIGDRDDDLSWIQELSSKMGSFASPDSELQIYGGDMQNDTAIITLKNYAENFAFKNRDFIEISRGDFFMEMDGEQLLLSASKCRAAIQSGDTEFLSGALSEPVKHIIDSL